MTHLEAAAAFALLLGAALALVHRDTPRERARFVARIVLALVLAVALAGWLMRALAD